jgi:kynureninase
VSHDHRALDRADPLASFRNEFVISDPDLIYLDGNSLGRLPKATVDLVGEVTERQWGDRLIRSWNEGWWDLQLRLGAQLSSILGAHPHEVIISDSTSVNLYKLADAAVTARPGRSKIVTDDLNFSTDVYVLSAVAERHGLDLVVVRSDGINGPVERLSDEIDGQTALVSLSHTAYMSGYTYDMTAINDLSDEMGALTLWDTSHSVGSVPIDFRSSGSALAVGCTYKHLNGGPGSPAFLFVREDLQDVLSNPIQAWWAHERPFEFDLDFRPVSGIRRFHTGTMPTLSLAPIEPGLELVSRAGLKSIREKSVALSEYMIGLFDELLAPIGFELGSPRDASRRGSHVAVRHSEGLAITRALVESANVIPDFRAPDTIRFGLSPLYTTFGEVHEAVTRLDRIVRSHEYRRFENVDIAVT